MKQTGELQIILTTDNLSDSVVGRNLKEQMRRMSDPEWNIIQQSRAYCEFKADTEQMKQNFKEGLVF